MKEQLAEALKDGFVEMTPTGNFRFAHDRIRESAYSLLPEGLSRKEVHLKVGRQLRAWMDAQEECKFTFENPE
jgi:predicted ATPase